eukprot:6203260-Pleurochrysis_carterae.AAC.2
MSTTLAPLSCQRIDARVPTLAACRPDLEVREYVAHGCIELRKVDTAENVADVFTKSLPVHVHHKYMNTARNV